MAGQTCFFCTHFQEDERYDRLLRKRQAEGLPVLLLLRQTRLYAEGLLLCPAKAGNETRERMR